MHAIFFLQCSCAFAASHARSPYPFAIRDFRLPIATAKRDVLKMKNEKNPGIAENSKTEISREDLWQRQESV